MWSGGCPYCHYHHLRRDLSCESCGPLSAIFKSIEAQKRGLEMLKVINARVPKPKPMWPDRMREMREKMGCKL